MKKIACFTVVFMFVIVLSVAAEEQPTVATFAIGSGAYSINGHTVQDVAPYIKDGRTLLPLRYVAYALGIGDDRIQWNPDTQSVFLLKDDSLVVIMVDQGIVVTGDPEGNTKTIHLEVPPEVLEGRIMLPIRDIAEIFNCFVHWDDEHKVVVIIN